VGETPRASAFDGNELRVKEIQTSILRSSRNLDCAKRQSEEKPIVVVIGMHRSGTSLCSHVLSALGIDMVSEVSPAPDNAKGHWERWEIMRLQDQILDFFNRSYFGPFHDFPLPAGWWTDPFVRQIDGEIGNFIVPSLSEGEIFGFKDPRTARLLPMWARIFCKLKLNPRYIFCIRSPGEVARSLEARDGLAREIGEYRAITYIFDILRNIDSKEFCVINYDSWFVDPIANLNKICEFLPFEPAVSLFLANVTMPSEH
jgi:hypothetical protein